MTALARGFPKTGGGALRFGVRTPLVLNWGGLSETLACHAKDESLRIFFVSFLLWHLPVFQRL